MVRLRNAAAIVGIGQTAFAKRLPDSELRLALTATTAALDDAGIDVRGVDGLASYTMERDVEVEVARGLGLGDVGWWAQVGDRVPGPAAYTRPVGLRQPPAYVHAFGQGLSAQHVTMTNYYRDDPLTGPGWACARVLWERAALGPEDVDVAQMYDAFSPLVPLSLEAYGFCKRGDGGPFTEDGGIELGGQLPVNTSGGGMRRAVPGQLAGSAEELAYVLADLEPTVVLWQSEREVADTIRAVRRASEPGEWVDADTEYEDLLAAAEPNDPALDDDPLAPVLYMYTAAFTGRPRAAMLGHAGLLAQGLTVAMVQGITPEYVYLNCGPLFHIATFMTTVATFHLGGTNVFTPRADPQEIAGLVHEERCTGALLMPQTMKALDEIEHSRGYDLSSLRSVSSPWLKRPGGYGQTEVTGLLTLSAFGDGPMAPGRAMPMASVRIVDEDGADVPDGEVGKIVCRGPLAMVGYWRDPEETARRRRGGRHHTGDLGRRQPDGTVAFVGPKTELIKTGAENVYPAEVEGALQRHEAVAETAVIGVPDPQWGQSVKAVVKLRDGATATADELIEHVRGLIPSYKKPRYVDVVESFPRLASGVVDREAVQAAHGGGGTHGRG